jgi:SAM-dependent methyltransferase
MSLRCSRIDYDGAMSSAYQRSAALYDAMYGDKPFVEETAAIKGIVARMRPGARTLLDVGCGTGGHLAHAREWISVEGLDVSEPMLEVARRKLPDVPLHHGDMRSFALDRRFDVVTSLFSAIGYVRSTDELDAAIAAMARHLEPAGLLAVEPWFTPAQWKPATKVHGGMLVDRDDIKVARLVVSETRGRFAVTPMHHLVATLGGVEHFVETHELFLAEPEEMQRAFAAAGLVDVQFVPGVLVRGLWLGRRTG